MEEPISVYISEVIGILLAAILLSIVVIFSTSARQLIYTTDTQKQAQTVLSEYKNISMYDKKTILGSDIPDVILKYTRYYSFQIVIGNTTYNIDAHEEDIKGQDIWTQDYIVNNVLKDNIYSKFESTIIRDDYDMVSGMKFIKE